VPDATSDTSHSFSAIRSLQASAPGTRSPCKHPPGFVRCTLLHAPGCQLGSRFTRKPSCSRKIDLSLRHIVNDSRSPWLRRGDKRLLLARSVWEDILPT
jgi:hypothetical protein